MELGLVFWSNLTKHATPNPLTLCFRTRTRANEKEIRGTAKRPDQKLQNPLLQNPCKPYRIITWLVQIIAHYWGEAIWCTWEQTTTGIHLPFLAVQLWFFNELDQMFARFQMHFSRQYTWLAERPVQFQNSVENWKPALSADHRFRESSSCYNRRDESLNLWLVGGTSL